MAQGYKFPGCDLESLSDSESDDPEVFPDGVRVKVVPPGAITSILWKGTIKQYDSEFWYVEFFLLVAAAAWFWQFRVQSSNIKIEFLEVRKDDCTIIGKTYITIFIGNTFYREHAIRLFLEMKLLGIERWSSVLIVVENQKGLMQTHLIQATKTIRLLIHVMGHDCKYFEHSISAKIWRA